MEIAKIKCNCKYLCPDTISLELLENNSYSLEYKDGFSGLTRRIFFDKEILSIFTEAIQIHLISEKV